MTVSLVIQTSFLGDTVLTTPLLASLAARGPVDVLTTPSSAAILVHHPAVRRVLVYDKRGAQRGIRGFLATAAMLRAERYDAVFLAQGSWRSATLALLAGIPERIGFATSGGSLLYTRRIPYPAHAHHADRLLALASVAGEPVSIGLHPPRLHAGDAEREVVDALLRTARVDPAVPLIALAPGSLWTTKRWPYYPELAAELSRVGRVVIIGGPDDRGLAQAIVDMSPHAVDATGRLTPLGSSELIRRCAVIVTNDSGPLHLASAVATPTVAVFGPTVPAFGFGPLAPSSVIVEHEQLACRPCAAIVPVECPLGHFRCMREISPVDVANHVLAVLGPAHRTAAR